MSKRIKIISVLLIGLIASINTATARFMSMDPAAVNPNDPASFNRYAYANNNPYRYVDPDGRSPALIFRGIGLGLMLGDMANNEPVPGHEQDGVAPVITIPGPLKLGGRVAEEAVEQSSKVVAKTIANATRPHGVPKGWVEQAGKKSGHTKYVNPKNPHDYVRVKPDGTITQVRNGKAFDANGDLVDLKSPDAHGITPDKFIFRE